MNGADMKPRIIFIAGTDLSGSTVLDLAFGSLDGVVGLGEVDNLLDSEKRRQGEMKVGNAWDLQCSCGEFAPNCGIWSRVLSHIEKNPHEPYGERYMALIQTVDEKCPGTKFIVDSSKQISALKKVFEMSSSTGDKSSPLSVAFIRRDPIDWLISDIKRAGRRGRKRSFAINRRRIAKWAKRNEELLKYCSSHSIRTSHYGLKKFQAKPAIINRHSAFDSSMSSAVSIGNSSSHVLWGSHHRFDPHRSKTIEVPKRPRVGDFLAAFAVVMTVPHALAVNWKLARYEKN